MSLFQSLGGLFRPQGEEPVQRTSSPSPAKAPKDLPAWKTTTHRAASYRPFRTVVTGAEGVLLQEERLKTLKALPQEEDPSEEALKVLPASEQDKFLNARQAAGDGRVLVPLTLIGTAILMAVSSAFMVGPSSTADPEKVATFVMQQDQQGAPQGPGALQGEEKALYDLMAFYRAAVYEKKGATPSPEVKALRTLLKAEGRTFTYHGDTYLRYASPLTREAFHQAVLSWTPPASIAPGLDAFQGVGRQHLEEDLWGVFHGRYTVYEVKGNYVSYEAPRHFSPSWKTYGWEAGTGAVLVAGALRRGRRGRRQEEEVLTAAEGRLVLEREKVFHAVPPMAQEAVQQAAALDPSLKNGAVFERLEGLYEEVVLKDEQEKEALEADAALRKVEDLAQAWRERQEGYGANSSAAEARWAALLEEEQRLIAVWLSYERDLTLRIHYPLMRDFEEPSVAATVKAMSAAAALRAPTPPLEDLKHLPFQELEYPKAVLEFRENLTLAEARAKQVGRSDFSPEDMKRLQEAERLLAMAQNEASSPAERRLCYERVIKVLENLEKPIRVEPEVLQGILEAAGLHKAITAA